ncbi:hypothetical protein DUW70_22330 [Stenotrophomonas maltophilia]|nr:hypothetical protein DUW70_22330 [Stenotrophomonas maltophilia]
MIQEVIKAYKEYGFKCETKYAADGLWVFTLNNGYFNNAEIVSMEDSSKVSEAFDQYTLSGYACTLRKIRSAHDVEAALFKGFFSVDSSRERLRSDYNKFTKSITSPYSSLAKYKYINAPYFINGKEGDVPVATEIISRLESDRPALFLIEAAAGFGKTCTAYEVVNEILEKSNRLPLFSELSRNRSAKIFRYVLLDEIDRTFPQLKSRLVESEISKGRVVVVLDGFDELLRKSDSGQEFERAEPMLETIGELLKSKAKIILTTRRTVLFEGDDFHRWMDANADSFDVFRFSLNEPRITDWLPQERRSEIEKSGISLEGIANPVLLSYLRCIEDQKFTAAIESKDELVESYFSHMLDRERSRQDLRLDIQGQYSVLTGIARDMIELGYTSEDREYIVEFIKSSYIKVLDEVRSGYSSSEKPSRDEVANKLASHALLDRSASDDSKIGFINEFVFGNFVAENIISDPAWMNDDLRFLEPAVLSHASRSPARRAALKGSLSSVMEFLDWTSRIDFSCRLDGGIDYPLSGGEADSLSLEGVTIGQNFVSQFQFNDCTFKKCSFDLSHLSAVTFLNCKFYECGVRGIASGQVHILGCFAEPEFIAALGRPMLPADRATDERSSELDKFILEKFWPVGSLNFHRRRPIKGICSRSNDFSPEELYEGIRSLKQRGLIFEPSKPSFVEISIDHLGEIRDILGRVGV